LLDTADSPFENVSCLQKPCLRTTFSPLLSVHANVLKGQATC
jgi:hypothetical protein